MRLVWYPHQGRWEIRESEMRLYRAYLPFTVYLVLKVVRNMQIRKSQPLNAHGDTGCVNHARPPLGAIHILRTNVRAGVHLWYKAVHLRRLHIAH
jgi:hypothetical protein